MNRPPPPVAHESPARTYESYFVPALFVPWTRVLLEHAAPRRGERVLDVACGTGVVARHVAPLVGAEGKVAALDISPAMLDVARSVPAPTGATIEWHEGSALGLPFPDAAFDLVLCQQGVQFFPDRSAGVREMRRVLAPGGRVLLNVWQAIEHNPVYEVLYRALAGHLGMTTAELASPFSLADARALRELLDGAGFQKVEIRPISMTLHLPDPERFVHLTVLSSAAVLPAFGQLDAAARVALVDAVTREIEPALRPFRENGMLASPTATHIALAQA